MPPVETISIPSSARPRANSTSAGLVGHREQRTGYLDLAGGNGAQSRVRCSVRPLHDGLGLYRSITTRRGLAGSKLTAPRGEQPDRLGEQLVLDRVQALEHRVRIARVGQLDRALQDHRPGVDAPVDEVDGDAEHLDPVGERLLDRAAAPGTRAAAPGAR